MGSRLTSTVLKWMLFELFAPLPSENLMDMLTLPSLMASLVLPAMAIAPNSHITGRSLPDNKATSVDISGWIPFLRIDTYFVPDEVYPYNAIFVLDLTLSDRELYANLSRTESGSSRIGTKLLPALFWIDQPDQISSWHVILISSGEKNASSAYHFSEETLSFLTNLPNVFIVSARKAEKVVAVSVFGYTPDAGDFLFNVSVPEGRSYSTALIWYGVQHLKALGIPLLNLGGGGHEDDSLADFKARFGSRRLPLRCVKQIYQREVYDHLCQRVNVDPNDMTGYFPAYRTPR